MLRVVPLLPLAMLLLTASLSGCRSFETDKLPAPPEDGLLLHYAFNATSGTRVEDSSGNGLHALLFGNTRWVRGVAGGAIALDGTVSSYAEDPDGAKVFDGLDAVTLAAWVKSDSVGSDAGFFICEPPEGHDRALSLRYDAVGARTGETNGIKGGITLYTGEQSNFETPSYLQTSSWQHLVMTWASGSGFRLFVDGRSVELSANPVTTGTISGMSTILVGKGAKDATSSWRGSIDEVFVYGRTLSEAEVGVLYERGTR